MDHGFANHIGWSDINPFEIIRKVSEKTLVIREMKAERSPDFKPEYVPGGFSAICVNQGDQKWVIESDPDNPEKRIRLHRNGQWKDKYGNKYRLNDHPVKYYDFNF